jgi:hypothetical protein
MYKVHFMTFTVSLKSITFNILPFFSSIRQTCHRLFIDTSINSKRQMLKNVYQIFLLAVFKLHIHIKNLPFHQKADRNSRFFFGKTPFDKMLGHTVMGWFAHICPVSNFWRNKQAFYVIWKWLFSTCIAYFLHTLHIFYIAGLLNTFA